MATVITPICVQSVSLDEPKSTAHFLTSFSTTSGRVMPDVKPGHRSRRLQTRTR
jgi:hypothetical protein